MSGYNAEDFVRIVGLDVLARIEADYVRSGLSRKIGVQALRREAPILSFSLCSQLLAELVHDGWFEKARKA